MTQRQFYKCRTFAEYSKSDDRGQYRVFLHYAVNAVKPYLLQRGFVLHFRLVSASMLDREEFFTKIRRVRDHWLYEDYPSQL